MTSAVIALAHCALFAVVEESLRRGVSGFGGSSRARRRRVAAVSTSTLAALVAGLWTATVGVRAALGFVFGRATGWQWPGLFFGGAVHEWSCGKLILSQVDEGY